MNLFIIIGLVVVLVGAAVLVLVGLRSPEAKDPLQSRLAEFGSRERPVTLEEIEMSQPFSERVLLPIIRSVGQMTTRFTPEAALEATQHKLDLAGNPGNLDPKMFMAIRIIASVGLGFVLLLAFSLAPEPNWIQNLGLTGLFVALGYYLPELWLSSKITRRQDEVVKALPDALDLLTVCVEAGLGFDAALGKLTEKWENDLALAFGRVLQEVRLGKTRREALRDMSYRLDVPDVTSFIAAVLQAEQLGVSMGKILRIQSDQMRIKRRQRAEQKAHQAPIKMLFPMALLIFPTIWLVLLGPAVLLLKNSALSGILGG
ncbi:MAG: type II secretion system F family protein [Chloroflexi bacterium]|nr:type II secretion system F family protein [Chloroflexota bacterium]MBI5052216.1 type II secretion system F family protein [Chloroflexota bacterium]MBI5079791.1 type II secretion system F family protein [Chloroflexota bacterium]MBI5347856.1 type II secretion system F family protein [Chloroflexota bacterium]MBI5712804.1 type II secretion system F family protein [Chloroflexota bacterium]